MFVNNLIYSLIITCAVIQVYADNSNELQRSIPVNKTTVTEINLNNFFDKRLSFIRRVIVEKGMDPMEMPDMLISITDIPALKAHIHLQRGWLQQLATIRREGNVIVRYDNKLLEFDLSLGWDSLDATFAYTLRYLMGTRKGDCTARFENLKIAMLGSMDMETYQLNLRFFKFIDVGRFSLRLEGHLADHLINAVTKFLTVIARERILRELESQVVKVIQEKINEINDNLPDPMKVVVRTVPGKKLNL